jgi:hypothetical protein
MLLATHIPTVSRHFQQLGLSPDLYFYDWFVPLFSNTLSFDLCTRVWDCYLLYEDVFLFRTALSILQVLSSRLEVLGTKEEVLQELMQSTMSIEEEVLFKSIGHYTKSLSMEEYTQWLNRCL